MSGALTAVALAAMAGACLPADTGIARLGRLRGDRRPPVRRPLPARIGPTRGAQELHDHRPGWWWWRWQVTRRRFAARRRAAVIELCAALAAELRSGGTPRDALAAASRHLPDLGRLGAVAAAPHGAVSDALRAAAGLPGAGGLRLLAACWQVSERSGGGLAAAVLRLSATLRDEEQVRREVAAQLAGPRATAVLLALLPAFGVLMGTALGLRPVAVLVGTPVGRGCLLAGLLLEAAGLWWTARIARRAEPP